MPDLILGEMGEVPTHPTALPDPSPVEHALSPPAAAPDQILREMDVVPAPSNPQAQPAQPVGISPPRSPRDGDEPFSEHVARSFMQPTAPKVSTPPVQPLAPCVEDFSPSSVVGNSSGEPVVAIASSPDAQVIRASSESSTPDELDQSKAAEARKDFSGHAEAAGHSHRKLKQQLSAIKQKGHFEKLAKVCYQFYVFYAFVSILIFFLL